MQKPEEVSADHADATGSVAHAGNVDTDVRANGGRVEPHAPSEHSTAVTIRAGWHASLDLEFAARADRTYLARRAHIGPLVVQRPFYPEGGVCHAYIVHPPGGIVGGDRLELTVHLGPGSHALLTTPAATKFYRNTEHRAVQSQTLELDRAALEWLPQETIFYPHASARVSTKVQLCKQSRFIGWEIVCFGRPASGLDYAQGRVAQDFELWLEGSPLLMDRLRLDGATDPMHAAYGLAGQPVMATLLAYPANAALVGAIRESMDSSNPAGERHVAGAGHAEGASRVPDASHAAGASHMARSINAPDASHVAAASNSSRPAASAPRLLRMNDESASIQTLPPIHFACSHVDGALVARAVGRHVDQVRGVMENVWRRLRPQVIGRDAVAPRIWST